MTDYPGTGFQGFDRPTANRAGYGDPAPGRRPRPPYGRRAGAYVVDLALTTALPVIGVLALATGPTELRGCVVDGEARICEVPTSSSQTMFWVLVGLGVAVWLLVVGREGVTGVTPGKSMFGLRTVGVADGEPLGAARAIGRGLVRGLLAVTVVGGIVDVLSPLWDRDAQAVHDKAVGGQVIDGREP